METGIISVCQALIFAALNLAVYLKVRNTSISTRAQKVFGKLAITCFAMQLATAGTLAFCYGLLAPHPFIQHGVYTIQFSLMTTAACFWFGYTRLTIPGKGELTGRQITLSILPISIILVLGLISYWTHWIYYVDSSLVYQRGPLFALLILCPYIYILNAIIVIAVARHKNKGQDVSKAFNYLMLIVIPSVIGVIIRFVFNIDAGLTQIGISVGMILIYLNMYLNEVHESERLEHLENINLALKKSNEEQQLQFQKLQAQYDVVQALSSSYFSIHEVNLENGTFRELETVRDIRDMVNIRGMARDAFDAFVAQNVASPFKVAMRDFTDLDTLSDKLKDKTSTFIDYVSLARNGWCRASWFVLNRKANGDISKALFTVANVDNEIRAEMEQRNIVNSLAQQFSSLYLIDMSNYHFDEISSLTKGVHEIIGETGDAREKFNLMFEKICTAETKEPMQEFCDLTTLNDRLRNKTWMTQQFNSRLTGWSEGTFIVVNRDENGDCSHVVWCTRNVNEIKQKELKYEKNLSDIIEAQQRDLDILSTLSKAYIAVYYVDIKSETFFEVSASSLKEVSAHIGTGGNARAKFLEMSKYLVIPEMCQTTLEFTELSTLAERLKEQNSIQFSFQGAHIGWCVGEFIVVNRNENGECTHVLWSIRSIQGEKEKDEQHKKELQNALSLAESANNAKTTFLNNMSHDIRTPMNAILGFTQLMEKEKDNPQIVSDYLAKMQSAGEYLLTIINNVLDMARIESGKMTLDEDFMDLRESNKTAIAIFEQDAKKKNIKFNVISNFTHPCVMLDITKTKEIATNLLSNAIKYTPEGGSITVEMREEPSPREGYGTYIMIVKDTGIGMSDEFKEHIFESFTRERNSTESKVAGTGLGMSIVKKLVDFLGGTITVESELGKGTTFTVTMEHKFVDDPEKYLVKRKPENISIASLKGKRILMAEDNELNAEIAMTILKNVGIETERAADGIICVDMLNNASAGYYDMILMDIQMPNMNGYEATRLIREMDDKQKANIPIVAMTANAFDEDKKAALEAGMNGHLSKPINVSELVKELNRNME
ncbi:His Kinase A (phospho-acceptor) domain-containing protein [Fibrobacter sp. UWEL]|nr:His Kinase A (phospho-acceptor) domain-containing protein [Fibrobacter sp. UWEL]